jgi:hypothetical protein
MITSLTDIYIYVDVADQQSTLAVLRQLTEDAQRPATPAPAQ